jgi:ribosomal protein L13
VNTSSSCTYVFANHQRRAGVDMAYRHTVRTVLIKSFRDKRTAATFAGHVVRDMLPQIQRRARAKLLAIDGAKRLDELRATRQPSGGAVRQPPRSD